MYLSAGLFATMGFLATEPKDQIFGIMGLVRTDGSRLKYEDSVQDTYMHAVQGALTEEKGFDILYVAGITHKRNIADLPSWALISREISRSIPVE